MYRYIRSSEIMHSRFKKCEKLVRDYIWQCFAQGGKYFNDSNMLSNIEFMKWYNSDENISWAEYVYKNRHNIFDTYVLNKIDNDSRVKSDQEREHMVEYFNNLQPTDYNRILYLKRDSTERGVADKLRSMQDYTEL